MINTFIDELLCLYFFQDKVVDAVNDGVASAKQAARSASETVNENAEALKDSACK